MNARRLRVVKHDTYTQRMGKTPPKHVLKKWAEDFDVTAEEVASWFAPGQQGSEQDAPLLTSKDVADRMRVSLTYARKQMSTGVISSIQIGREWRTSEAALNGYLSTREITDD